MLSGFVSQVVPTPMLTSSSVVDVVHDEAFRPLSVEQQAMLAVCPFPVLVLDSQFRIRFVNQETLALSGVSAESLIGHNVWQRYPHLEGSIFHQAYAAVLREKQSRRFEEYRAADDTWRSVYAYPADDGVVAVLENVTEVRRGERALRESERALARAQELAAIGSWDWAVPTTLRWTAETFRILGLDPTAVVADFSHVRARLVDSGDVDAFDVAIDRMLHCKDVDLNLTMRRDDGRTVQLQLVARVSCNEEGRASHVFGTIQDLTDRFDADEKLRRSEKTLRLAQETANVGSFDRDLRTGTTEWSEQLVRLLGFDPATFDRGIGVDATLELVHPDDRERMRDAYQLAISTREKQTLRHRVVLADGTVRHFLSSAMLVRDGRGEPARVVGTSLDITEQVRAEDERVRLEAQIQQAQKLESLGILAGGIAHDFNNLLVGILGNASLALLDLETDNCARRSVEQIEQAAQRAAELTRQLLAYAGKGRFVVETVDASAVVSEMATLLRTVVHPNASVNLNLSSVASTIEVDTTQLRQVVMNLITNASDALNGAAGSIAIHTGQQTLSEEYLATCVQGTNAKPGRYVFVEVRDSGTGMDAATVQRIFEPFYSTKFTGRGLGLSATLGIMRGHSGAIRVYSEPGSGTSFKLHFPASGLEPTPPTPQRDTTWRGTGRVLVVDDEAAVRTVVRALLQRRGFEVDEARDGDEALVLFASTNTAYELILLDLTMPGIGGEATFRQIRESSNGQRVLLMSGYNEQEVTQRFVGRGLAGFLQKPFRADELYATVARTLQLGRAPTD